MCDPNGKETAMRGPSERVCKSVRTKRKISEGEKLRTWDQCYQNKY